MTVLYRGSGNLLCNAPVKTASCPKESPVPRPWCLRTCLQKLFDRKCAGTRLYAHLHVLALSGVLCRRLLEVLFKIAEILHKQLPRGKCLSRTIDSQSDIGLLQRHPSHRRLRSDRPPRRHLELQCRRLAQPSAKGRGVCRGNPLVAPSSTQRSVPIHKKQHRRDNHAVSACTE